MVPLVGETNCGTGRPTSKLHTEDHGPDPPWDAFALTRQYQRPSSRAEEIVWLIPNSVTDSGSGKLLFREYSSVYEYAPETELHLRVSGKSTVDPLVGDCSVGAVSAPPTWMVKVKGWLDHPPVHTPLR